jgi:hypothetical protein
MIKFWTIYSYDCSNNQITTIYFKKEFKKVKFFNDSFLAIKIIG